MYSSEEERVCTSSLNIGRALGSNFQQKSIKSYLDIKLLLVLVKAKISSKFTFPHCKLYYEVSSSDFQPSSMSVALMVVYQNMEIHLH